MPKRSLINNKSSDKNISMLLNKLLGNRVLVVAAPLQKYSNIDFRNYFDAILVENEKYWPYDYDPDIFIYTPDTVYENGFRKERLFSKADSSICCINMLAAEEAARVRLTLPHQMLTFIPIQNTELKDTPDEFFGIDYGLSHDEPGIHLALIAGSIDIFINRRMVGKKYAKELPDNEVQTFVSKKGEYGIPSNLRNSNRKNIIDTIIW